MDSNTRDTDNSVNAMEARVAKKIWHAPTMINLSVSKSEGAKTFTTDETATNGPS